MMANDHQLTKQMLVQSDFFFLFCKEGKYIQRGIFEKEVQNTSVRSEPLLNTPQNTSCTSTHHLQCNTITPTQPLLHPHTAFIYKPKVGVTSSERVSIFNSNYTGDPPAPLSPACCGETLTSPTQLTPCYNYRTSGTLYTLIGASGALVI